MAEVAVVKIGIGASVAQRREGGGTIIQPNRVPDLLWWSRRLDLVPLVLFLLVIGGPAHGQDDEAPAEPAIDGIAYTVTIDVPEESGFEDDLTAVSNLLSLQERQPSAVGLLRRVADDVDRLRQALRSRGYYAGRVTALVDGQPPDTPGLATVLVEEEAREPFEVAIAVDPGPLYRIGEIAINMPPDGPAIDIGAIGIAVGDPAEASSILSAEAAILSALRNAGHPFAAVPGRRALVDHAAQEMTITFTAEPGPPAVMGEVAFEGLGRVSEPFVERRIPFSPGDPYRPGRVDGLRSSLEGLDVFSAVRILPAETLTDEGALDILVETTERPRRFVGFGADFATSEGLGFNAYWGHRNVFGQAERVRIDASVGRLIENPIQDIEAGLGGTFRKPDFLTRNQDLLVGLSLVAERPDAFEREALEASIALERRFGGGLTGSAGATFEAARVDDGSGERDTGLIGFPITLRLDTTDELLDPSRGVRISGTITPYPVALGDSDRFVTGELDASTYLDVTGDRTLILAARGAVGALAGADLDDVPANRRFFSGGGGSVRGYAFQAIGPLGDDGDPVGGRSLIEAGLEARVRVGESFGVVPFVELGGVFDNTLPGFDEELQYAAGLGLRYYTGIGPLRLDVGVPLNPRDRDDAFQLYLSIGQAF